MFKLVKSKSEILIIFVIDEKKGCYFRNDSFVQSRQGDVCHCSVNWLSQKAKSQDSLSAIRNIRLQISK